MDLQKKCHNGVEKHESIVIHRKQNPGTSHSTTNAVSDSTYMSDNVNRERQSQLMSDSLKLCSSLSEKKSNNIAISPFNDLKKFIDSCNDILIEGNGTQFILTYKTLQSINTYLDEMLNNFQSKKEAFEKGSN